MIELKSPAEIERMHTTGQFVAEVLAEVGELAAVGVNLLDLEHHARRRIRDAAPSPATGTTPRRSAAARSAT